MNATIRSEGRPTARAHRQVLSNNIEAYENTIPAMLSDRLRNPKFSGPEDPQTGIAREWGPAGNGMSHFSCRLVPGMYLSGREAQLLHNYSEKRGAAIVQVGVPVREGEVFEVEVWLRAHHRPTEVTGELRLAGRSGTNANRAVMAVELGHWHRVSGRIESPGDGKADFALHVAGGGRVVVDQVHLRPVDAGIVNPHLDAIFDAIPCPVLRFPGGCESCTYHWEHGTGPHHLRPVCDDPVFKYKVHYDFGTDEYLELCERRNIRPFLTLNTTTATPEDAAAWARYVRAYYKERDLPIPEAYFMFGNENYGIWEIGHMTGEMYLAQLREFAPAVREAYPEAKLLAIGESVSHGLSESEITPWREVLLEHGTDLFDSLVVTRYSRATDNMPLAEGIKAVADSVHSKGRGLEDISRDFQARKPGGTIGLVEWNFFTRASHHDQAGFYEPNDIRHCLYAAGMLHNFCRMGESMEVANYYSLINTMGMVHLSPFEASLSDVVKVFALYDGVLPGEVMDLEVEAPMLSENSKVVDALCIRSDAGSHLFLVNYSADETVLVDWKGPGSPGSATGLSASAILSPVSEIEVATKPDGLSLPPLSIVKISLNE